MALRRTKASNTIENTFFVPENVRWSVIATAAHTLEIGTVIDEAVRSIEKEKSGPRIFSLRTLPARSWTSAAWGMW